MQFLIEPWPHQLAVIERAKDLPHFALFMDLGTGKTATVINIIRHKCTQAGRLMRTLYVGPLIIIQNVKREFTAHSKMGPHVVCLEGTGLKRQRRLEDEGFSEEGSLVGKVFVTNYESLLMADVFRTLELWKPEIVVWDESHRLKSMSAKRTKLAIKLAGSAKHRYILTGTPILNNLQDIFPQYLAMDGGATFGRNPHVFRAQYLYDKNASMPKDKHFPLWLPRPGAVDELHKKIQPLSVVLKKADCLDLPPLVRQTVHVELSREQSRLYNEMKKDFIAYVNDKACVAQLAITKALRMQQIVSGFVTLEGGDGEDRTDVTLKENPRASALKELLGDIAPDAKCLVWCVFKSNYAAVRTVCKELDISYVEVHGEVSAKGKQEAVDAFNTDPAIRVFIGHPMSGGIGINLVPASYSIFYSRSFSLEQDLQAEARNHRGGSEIHEKITRIDLVATGTIDELISQKLAQKVELSEKVLLEMVREL